MKRAVSLLLSAVMLTGLLGACRGPAAGPEPAASPSGSEPSASPSNLAADVDVLLLADLVFQFSGREDMDGLEAVAAEMDREWMTAYLENAYGLQDPWEDAVVVRATGASAFELAVLKFADDGAAVRGASSLMSYIFARQGDFAGYAPAEADMAAGGGIRQIGPWLGLFICPDPDRAEAAFEAELTGQDPPRPSWEKSASDVKELRDILVARQGMDGAELERLDDGDPDALNAYVRDVYGLTPDQWEECAIARGTGTSAFEIAVLRVPEDWEVSNQVSNRLNGYLDAREAAFDGPADQLDMLHRAITIAAEDYAVLLCCKDRDAAMTTFSNAAGTHGYGWSNRYRYLDTDPNHPDRCAFTAPNNDDMSLYDTSAIRAAWERGDPAGLSDYDRSIYDAAGKVLKTVLKDGMSGYEKEAAVYGWIVNNVDYDWTHQNRMETTPRESFTPYGGLVNHTAVCLGYAATFQLLMDLAGVECITVTGAAFSSREDHAWNMVRLNGQWYCVDVTWDANYREQSDQAGLDWPEEYWNHFNVTSDSMADEDHQWDYANTPEATAEDHGRG